MDKRNIGQTVVLKDEWKIGEVPVWPVLGPMQAIVVPEGTKALLISPPGMDGYVVILIGNEAYNVWHENLSTRIMN